MGTLQGACMHFAASWVCMVVAAAPHVMAPLDSAEVYYASGNYAAVVRVLQGPTSLKPRQKLLLGWSEYQMGRMQQATATFEAGLALAPENTDLINGHAFALYRLGDATRAEAEFRRVLERNPGREESFQGLAQVLYTSRRFEECLPMFDRMSRLHPGDSEAQHHILKSVDGMLTAWNAAGRTPAEMVAKAWQLAADNRRSALEIFRWVLTLDPFRPGARLGLGTLGPAFGREPEARRCLEELLRENPDDLEARAALARLHLDAGRVAEAETQVEKLLAARPGDARALALQREVDARLGSKSQ